MKAILENAALMERLLGLTPAQFAVVLGRFNQLVRAAHFDKTVRGRERMRARTDGSRGGFNDTSAMLAFTLFYYRWYPMQTALGQLFGLTQQWASNWIRHLTPMVGEALRRRLVLPDRKPLHLEALLEHEPQVVLLTDQPFAPRRRRASPRLKRALENAGL